MSSGICAETFRFLNDIRENNDKDWFDENRNRYKSEWLEPAQDFIADLSGFMADLSPAHQSKPKVNGSIRRINRDVRFSADKTPYNPALHIVFWSGNHPVRSPAIHYVLHPESVGYGAGHFAMTPQELISFRDALLTPEPADELDQILKAAKAIGCDLTEETLKKLPSGIPDDTGRGTLFRRKGLVVQTSSETGSLDPSDFLGDEALLQAKRIALELAPLNGWLKQNLA